MFQFKSFLFSIISIGVLFFNTSQAQDEDFQIISLQDALEAALLNNRQIRIADYEVSAAEAEKNSMKSIYLPKLDVSVSATATNLPLNAFGSILQQGAIEQSDFIPASLNEPSTIANLQSQVRVSQPILNLDANSMKNAVSSKLAVYEQSSIRAKEILGYQISEAYLRLQLLNKAQDVLQQALETTQSTLSTTKDNVSAGYAREVDVLTVELHIQEIENKILETESNLWNTSDQLSMLMAVDMNKLYVPEDELSDDVELLVLETVLPSSRSDLNSMRHQVEAQEYSLQSSQRSRLPKINAFGSYEVNNSMDFNDAQHGFMLMVQASWNIFNGNATRGKVQKARVDLERSQMNLDQYIAQSQMEIELTNRKLINARNKISLEKKAIDVSKEMLRIKNDRFEEGLETTTEILRSETELAQKEMKYFEAVYEFRLTESYMKLLLGRN